MTSGAHKMYLSSNSYINLPVKTVSAIRNQIFAESENSEINSDKEFQLHQNYPNPFNPVTKISFSIPQTYSGIVSLKVYDVAGKEISSFVYNVSEANNGQFDISWNGANYSSGIYFYKLVAGNYNDIRKMILIK
jgi:hypothetical protein